MSLDLSFLEPENSPYLMKNHLLLVPSEWMLEPEVSSAIEESKPVLKTFLNDKEFRTQMQPKDIPVMKHITTHLPEVYSMPFFTEKHCLAILNEINHIHETHGFQVNEEEEKEVRIEEFVLGKNAPGWYASLFQLVFGKLNVVFEALFGRYVNDGIIQLANYNPKEITETYWHHDGNADITVVIPLNTGDYGGGGTEFFNRGVVDPLPSGHALIFPSFSHMHRGLPTAQGDRYLLVFWLKQPLGLDSKTEKNKDNDEENGKNGD